MSQFINYLEKIKDFISDSSEIYLNKLNILRDAGVFKTFNEILQNPISSDDQLKLLRFYDFLIETCSSQEELLIMFQDGTTNNLLSYPFELSSIDVLQSYMTILKGISMKVKLIPSKYIYQEDQGRCALFDHAIAYISHNDSTTIAAARFVVLNLFLCNIPNIIEIISQPATKNQIEHLITIIDTDGFAFIVDLMNVTPLEITEFTIDKLRTVLLQRDCAFLARAATFLADSKAKSMLMEVISIKLPTFSIKEPITLAFILFSLEKRLILADTAIKLGLLKNGSFSYIPKFSKTSPKTPTKAKIYQELAYIFQKRPSTIVVACILRLFEKLSPNEPPNIISTVRNEIINQLKSNITEELVELLNNSTLIHRQRTDIEYILSERDELPKSLQYNLLSQLAEIDASYCRWKKSPFMWYKVVDNPETSYQSFGTVDDGSVRLTTNELIIENTNTKYRLWDISILPNENKMHKNVTIVVTNNKSRRKSLVQNEQIKVNFEFQSIPVAMQFENEIFERQKELCLLTLNSIEEIKV